jgi:hypothetical protein
MILKVAVRFCGVLVLLLSGFSINVRAQSNEYAIYEFSCVPDDCADNYGPSTTGSALTTITAQCNNDLTQLGPMTAVLDIVSPCTHPVILETSAEATNPISVYDDGYGGYIAYYIGTIEVSATALDTVTNTLIYNQSREADCIGGVGPPLAAFSGC